MSFSKRPPQKKTMSLCMYHQMQAYNNPFQLQLYFQEAEKKAVVTIAQAMIKCQTLWKSESFNISGELGGYMFLFSLGNLLDHHRII